MPKARTTPETDAPAAPARAGKPRAQFNELFICTACSKCFGDRVATDPIEVRGTSLEVKTAVPHDKHPQIRELDTVAVTVVDANEDGSRLLVTVPAAEAGDCCAAHTKLADSTTLRFGRALDGTVSVIGATFLE